MNRLIFAACGLLLLSSGTWAASAPSGDKASAADLISQSQRAVGQTVRAAQAVPDMRAENSKAKPFWDAMKMLNSNLGRAQQGLAKKDEAFHTSLATASAATYQAKVAIDMNGGGNSALNQSMDTLMQLVERLDESYSKDAQRARDNAPLSRAEQKQLKKLMAQQDELVRKLELVERNAAKNSKEMQAGIQKLKKESKALKKNRKKNAAALRRARMMSSWMWAWHWWWGPWGAWCPGWIDINIIIWDGWLDAVPYDWAMADDLVDISDIDLADIDIADSDLAAWDNYLDTNTFDLSDGDMNQLSDHMDLGWQDVDSNAGYEVMDRYEQNFEAEPYQEDFEPQTFDHFGMDDFGGGFDDFGGDW